MRSADTALPASALLVHASMFAVIDWQSNLGLRPSGVEMLPTALRRAGLLACLGARDAGCVRPESQYDTTRSLETGMLKARLLVDIVVRAFRYD